MEAPGMAGKAAEERGKYILEAVKLESEIPC